MKKALLLTAGVILYSCGGGGGGTSSSTSTTYKLANLDTPEIAENTPTTSVRTIQSLTGVSETTATSRSTSENSKGWLTLLLQRSLKQDFNETRGESFAIRCDNNGYLNIYVDYELKEGITQPESCSDIKSISIRVISPQNGDDCVLGDYSIDGYRPFNMVISGADLKDPDCLPSKAEVLVNEGVVKHLKDSIPDEAYSYDNLKLSYSKITWSSEDISSADYSITGGATYYLGRFPSVDAQIDYYFDITGTGTETSDTFSGYIKLGCLDGWLKVDTLEPIKYSADGELQQGKIKVSAADGNFVIAYSDSGIDITETIGDQTETYHYNSFDEIKDSLQGVTCTYR